MPPLSLPPRRFSIPTRVLFGSQLPPAVFVTWLQLRSLTWCGQELQPFALQDWVDLTETSRTTFLRHLNLLQARHFLRWHSPKAGMVQVSFAGASFPARATERQVAALKAQPARPKLVTPEMVAPKMVSPKLVQPLSLNPLSSSSHDSICEPGDIDSWEDEEEVVVKDPEIKPLKTSVMDEAGTRGEEECEGERGEAILVNSPSADPATRYQAVWHITPTAAQRRLIGLRVSDLAHWERTLAHWSQNGHNPYDILGLLRLYGLVDLSACGVCRKKVGARE
jgi:hypothetical protein